MKAIRVLTDGEAAAYAAEYEDRLLLLNDPEVTDVVLTPFIHQPALIYTGDLPGDPEDPTSRKRRSVFPKDIAVCQLRQQLIINASYSVYAKGRLRSPEMSFS